MKRKNKIILTVFTFFLIIAIVIIGRTMIGNHFKKKFSKRPPPGIIVTEVTNKQFYESIDTFGTAISNKTKSFRIKNFSFPIAKFVAKSTLNLPIFC